MRRRGDLFVGVDHEHVAEHHAELGALGQHLHLASGLLGQPDIVGVEQADEVARGFGKGAVGGRGGAAIGLADEADAPRVTRRQISDDRGGTVLRAVVDDDDLEPVGRILLLERALDRAAHVLLVVVGAHQDADGGQAVGHPTR